MQGGYEQAAQHEQGTPIQVEEYQAVALRAARNEGGGHVDGGTMPVFRPVAMAEHRCHPCGRAPVDAERKSVKRVDAD